MISLHLTSSQLVSRVSANIDGEDYSAEFFGAAHQTRARAFAVRVRNALRHSKAEALNLIA